MRVAGILGVILFTAVARLLVPVGAPVQAGHCALHPPQGPILLEIAMDPMIPGQRSRTRHIALDRRALEAMPQDGFNTKTMWTSGEQSFRGVRLKTMLGCLGVDQGTVTLRASNAYLIEIPVETSRADGALIALERNGAPMSTRDLGPLWLVFPYDGDPSFRTESIYAQSIWQLDHIRVGP